MGAHARRQPRRAGLWAERRAEERIEDEPGRPGVELGVEGADRAVRGVAPDRAERRAQALDLDRQLREIDLPRRGRARQALEPSAVLPPEPRGLELTRRRLRLHARFGQRREPRRVTGAVELAVVLLRLPDLTDQDVRERVHDVVIGVPERGEPVVRGARLGWVVRRELLLDRLVRDDVCARGRVSGPRLAATDRRLVSGRLGGSQRVPRGGAPGVVREREMRGVRIGRDGRAKPRSDTLEDLLGPELEERARRGFAVLLEPEIEPADSDEIPRALPPPGDEE